MASPETNQRRPVGKRQRADHRVLGLSRPFGQIEGYVLVVAHDAAGQGVDSDQPQRSIAFRPIGHDPAVHQGVVEADPTYRRERPPDGHHRTPEERLPEHG